VSDETDALLSDAGHRRAMPRKNSGGRAHSTDIYLDLQRTQQTAAPLAEQLHFQAGGHSLEQCDDLIAAIRSEKAAKYLVVWHDATLPKILRALGAPEMPPIAYYGIRPLLHSQF